jgi:hypothetical protein
MPPNGSLGLLILRALALLAIASQFPKLLVIVILKGNIYT